MVSKSWSCLARWNNVQQENLEIFYNSSDLVAKLEEEAERKEFARFPVRFILIEDAFNWKEVINFLEGFVNTVVSFSEFCSGVDTYPNVNAGISKAMERTLKGERVLLIPLSELLRIDNAIKSRIVELIEFQVDPSKNGRLYIPLYCAKSYFFDIWVKHFDKIRLHPLLSLRSNYETTINVWIINDEELLIRDFGDFTTGVGFKDYLRIWETKDLPKKFLLYSNLLYEWTPQVTGEVRIFRIKNCKEFLEKVIGVDVPIHYTEEEKRFWRELVHLFVSTGSRSFDELVKKKLNVVTFSKEIFYRWKELEEFGRWLLFYWGKHEIQDKNSYLYYALQNSSNFFDFERMIWLSILYIEDIKVENIKERANLITKLELDIPPEFVSELRKIKHSIKKIKVITGITSTEKLNIIECLARCLKDGLITPELLEIIEVTFPELYYYLSIPDLENEMLNKYVENYVYAKIRNELTNELRDMSNKLYKTNMFLNFSLRNNVLEKHSNYPQIWIDGLGIEWIGLFYNFLRKKYKNHEVVFKITRANLPTTTEFNVIPENTEKELCLDHIFHETDYKHPESLIEEFECIKKIFEKIDSILKTHDRVVVTSDHGATRFSGWIDKKITTPKDARVERQGRYVISLEKPKEEEEYYIEKHEDGYYLISKLHRIFEGGKKVAGESHGGATIEEVLVPVIVIKRSKPIPRQIEILEKKISAFNPILQLRVYPPVDKVYLKILNRFVAGNRIDDENWRFDLKPLKLKPDKYKIDIELPTEVKEEVINIESGMEEEELL